MRLLTPCGLQALSNDSLAGLPNHYLANSLLTARTDASEHGYKPAAIASAT